MGVTLNKKRKIVIDRLSYINISRESDTIFEWKPDGSQKSYVLELNYIRKNEINDVYFHIERNNMKFVHIRKKNIIYTISSLETLQFQILEALLEQIFRKFNETFDVEVIFSFGNVTLTYFNHFKDILKDFLDEFYSLNLVKKIDIFCKICNKLLPLYVKRSVIENSRNFPVPIVYRHEGHSTICFIDKNFELRGTKPVVVTG